MLISSNLSTKRHYCVIVIAYQSLEGSLFRIHRVHLNFVIGAILIHEWQHLMPSYCVYEQMKGKSSFGQALLIRGLRDVDLRKLEIKFLIGSLVVHVGR